MDWIQVWFNKNRTVQFCSAYGCLWARRFDIENDCGMWVKIIGDE